MQIRPAFQASLRLGQLTRIAAVLLAGIATTTVHAQFERAADGVFKDRIDWGLMMDMSGPASAAQMPWVQGFQDFMAKVNEGGGIHGRKINVLAEDTRYDATLDRVAYEKFVNQTPVLGLSGLGNSSAQVALLPTIRRGKIPVVGTYSVPSVAVQPANPMYFGAFCGFKEMAQVGVGFFTDTLKLKNPKVATVHLDVASGKEYTGHVDAEAAKRGGSNVSIPIKVVAADATAQVLEIIKVKPDFVAVHGVPSTSILLMRAMQQYGLKIPTFAITYLGTPGVYSALSPETGANYHFVSCFTPGSVDDAPGVKEMSTAADKYKRGTAKDDVNYVAGWTVGQLASEAIARSGKEPTREKLVEALNGASFEVDTKGVSSPLKYTKDNHMGLGVLRPYSYDYQAKRFKTYGKYADFDQYVK